MDTNFGMKELYDVVLKATYPIEVNGRTIEEGEVIARFDRISLANFSEIVSRVSANGGYDNRSLIIWEDAKQINLSFSQGIFSKTQFALMNNARLLQASQNSILQLSCHVETETNEDGQIKISQKNPSKIFIYDQNTGKKVVPKSIDFEKGVITLEKPYQNIAMDYVYDYNKPSSVMVVGQQLVEGFLSLEGKTRVKDDITGRTCTAILRVPRLKLTSELSMRLGRDATPMVGSVNAIGLPVGNKGSKKIMELIFLEEDIDADM